MASKRPTRGPSLRQQAGYLRRLLRRGDIQLIDPRTGQPAPAAVDLRDGLIRLVISDSAPPADTPLPERARWQRVFHRLFASMSVDEAEDLAGAVELETKRSARPADDPPDL